MARFSFEEADNYGATKSNYFSLKDDKEVATIRFLLNDINDLQGVATHEVEVNGKKMDVECLRNYDEPVSKCPLCEAQYRQSAKLFIPVYDCSSKESKIWTRGKTFFNRISSLCARYNPLVSVPIEVERNGKKGDTSTTYEMYPGNPDNAKITDFPEINPEGICFETKTAEEMRYFLQNGVFPEANTQVARGTRQAGATYQQQREMPANQPIRRRPTYSNDEESF